MEENRNTSTFGPVNFSSIISDHHGHLEEGRREV